MALPEPERMGSTCSTNSTAFVNSLGETARSVEQDGASASHLVLKNAPKFSQVAGAPALRPLP